MEKSDMEKIVEAHNLLGSIDRHQTGKLVPEIAPYIETFLFGMMFRLSGIVANRDEIERYYNTSAWSAVGGKS